NNKTLALLYAKVKDAYTSAPLPPLGHSDHNIAHLLPNSHPSTSYKGGSVDVRRTTGRSWRTTGKTCGEDLRTFLDLDRVLEEQLMGTAHHTPPFPLTTFTYSQPLHTDASSPPHSDCTHSSAPLCLPAQQSTPASYANFWASISHEYPELAAEAMKILLPFPTTLTVMKNKYRARLQVEDDLKE
ncbi:hypothetical protein GOODEAATRI_027009, partial [Goodea atripinnis]